MKRLLSGFRVARDALIGIAALLIALPAVAQPVAGSLDVSWNEGAADCAATPQPPLQVHAYAPGTFILRQSPCASPEANFLYLLVGAERAMLIDTGYVQSADEMPLASTVMDLIAGEGEGVPLMVVHTHTHRDHRYGDVLFADIPGVGIAPAEFEAAKTFYGLPRWPEGTGRIDLGGRVVEIVPTPGHHPAHKVFYDAATGLVFSGDFLMPGRLLIDDIDAYIASADRLAGFIGDREVTHVLGGHIEMSASGRLFAWGATHHPDERALQLSREDIAALPAALRRFNGFHSAHPNFVLVNSKHILMAVAAGGLIAIGLMVVTLIVLWRRWRAKRAL